MNYKPAKVFSAAPSGLGAQLVEVEADVSVGLHSFQIVGLPDKSVEEAKERISSALKNFKFKHPRSFNKRVVINLAPADIKKEGVLYDLPIALSFLIASGQAKFDASNYIFVGELNLEGSLRPVKNCLSFSLLAKEKNIKYLVVPKDNQKEAGLVEGVNIVAISNLLDLIMFLENPQKYRPKSLDAVPVSTQEPATQNIIDMASINGQQNAKRALEIAASGGHNIMMQGPPGSGKTVLAQAFAGILPDMTNEEKIEVTQIYSLLGKIDPQSPLIKRRPFRNPHHSSSSSALIGGGPSLKPGEITLAHRGVLFMDEFPEFRRDVLEALRQPMESGYISVARARGEVLFPARFILVAAANPCPCGFYNDPEKSCQCFGSQLQRYIRKLSGPIADRIDIHVQVPHQKYEILTAQTNSERSLDIQKRVESARRAQSIRFKESKSSLCNADMSIEEIKKFCEIPPGSKQILQKAVDKDRLSARGYHKVLKLSRTIADLAAEEKIASQHVLEAISYNSTITRD